MKFKTFLKTYYPALLILGTLSAFTIFAYYQAQSASDFRRSRLFEQRVQRASASINQRMSEYVQILKGCQSLFYASDSITSADWKAYTGNLDLDRNYPGIQAIGFAKYIPIENKKILENTIRRSGYPEFKINSSFKNDHLAPIIFIEPYSGRNLRAFGFDMYGEDLRKAAMDRAMLSGKAALSAKVTLVQETDQQVQPGFLLYMPVYKTLEILNSPAERRNNLKGFVYYPFRAYDFMEVIGKRFSDLNVSIYDGDGSEENALLYTSLPDKRNAANQKTEFQSDTLISLAGRPWKIYFSDKGSFGSSIERNQPALILIFSSVISILIFIMSLNIIRRQAQIARELVLSKSLEAKKDEFIGIASHELKTPLTSIKAYIQILEKAGLKEPERNFVQKASSNVNKLNALITDLLDVSKIQAGRLKISNSVFNLETMIRDSVENVKHMYSSHQILVPEHIPVVTLRGDLLRMEQAMNNLLINAIKYSPTAKQVEIRVVTLQNAVRIEVIDQGLGISKPNQEKIFDRFYRAEELSPVISGLGMGLYITREIIRQHKGSIGVNSEEGKGSTFFFTLPAEKGFAYSQN